MDFIQPMEPVLQTKIPEGSKWVHQVKWDGIRGMCYVENGVRVFTKKGRERTEFYPEVQNCLKLTKAKQAVLDGELIVLDESGRPSFERALTREKVHTPAKLAHYMRLYPVYYMVFDLLYLNGQDLRQYPLYERRSILQDNFKTNERIFLTDDFGDGQSLFEIMKEKGMEGIVSKKQESIYQVGKKHHDWVKIKLNKKLLAVIGGIIFKENFPNSLLLGIFKGQNLVFIGKAAVGLTRKNIFDLKNFLTEYKSSIIQEHSPFANITSSPETVWLKPALTCWVHFLDWTESGTLRHPKILGFSDQVPQEAVGKEYLV